MSNPLEEASELSALRRSMHRFATLQLGDAQSAEDAVQEALMGAFKNQAAYAGKASLKTWVFAILKHKIADMLRGRLRMQSIHVHVGESDEEADLTELFDVRGHWDGAEQPASWGSPTLALEDKQFWKVFELCLDGLPPQQGRAFMMREYVGLEPSEVCAELAISTSNLHVMLHRARLRLRECLESRWFTHAGAPC
jgi:RNA polymerase sigma-70 factor (ECF subfamily)